MDIPRGILFSLRRRRIILTWFPASLERIVDPVCFRHLQYLKLSFHP